MNNRLMVLAMGLELAAQENTEGDVWEANNLWVKMPHMYLVTSGLAHEDDIEEQELKPHGQVQLKIHRLTTPTAGPLSGIYQSKGA